MIDLHLHSTFSDGTLTPTELVQLGARRGLQAISITDHDTIGGTTEALEAGRINGLQVISGLELSVFHDEYHFHLLGYDYDHTDRSLRDGLRTLQESRGRRNSAILGKLNQIGIGISEEELQAVSGGGQTGRPHIARILVAKKIVKTIDQAFAQYLKKGACAYVSRYILTVEEAISLIHDAGGIAVLAHPAQISYSIDTLDRLLRVLVEIGLDGVELYYPTQKGSFLNKLKRLSARYDLIETGGSDYHGDIRPNTDIAGTRNFTIPGSVLDTLMQRLASTEKRQITGR